MSLLRLSKGKVSDSEQPMFLLQLVGGLAQRVLERCSCSGNYAVACCVCASQQQSHASTESILSAHAHGSQLEKADTNGSGMPLCIHALSLPLCRCA